MRRWTLSRLVNKLLPRQFPNRRRSAKKASSSMLMLLIIAAAILVFLPFRVTIAAGTTGAGAICSQLSAAGGCRGLARLSGSHLTIDAPGILLNTSFTPVKSSILPILGKGFLALKAQRVAADITYQNNTTIGGLLPPVGPTSSPANRTTNGAQTIEVKLTLLSVTISGYNVPANSTNRYGERNLGALNPTLIVSVDRVIVDLFIDPSTSIATYIVSVDMTVYQGLALLLQTATR